MRDFRGGMAPATLGQSELTCKVMKSWGSSVVLRQSPLLSILLVSQWPSFNMYQVPESVL